MIKIKHINAFTSKPFDGNPAAVITKGDGLSESKMQIIAREMNLSETAFVLRPTRAGADMRLRWFTPTIEVSFCGHATIASFHALAEESRFGMNQPGQYSFRLETRSGILPVRIQKRSTRKAWIHVQLPRVNFSRCEVPLAKVLEALGITRRAFHPHLPVLMDNRRMLYIPLGRLSALFKMSPSFDTLGKVSEKNRLHGVCVFTTETIDQASDFHSRFFAPNYGINEDPVTGSSNGPLGAYLFQQGVLRAKNGKCLAIGEQGDFMGRKGRVSVEVEVADKGIKSVRIGGEAVTLFEGDLSLKA
jgi:trans-2,3-dihydro-3-hydroxyanthranilate isomerase